jgi:phosphoenolpyruvate carboxylase
MQPSARSPTCSPRSGPSRKCPRDSLGAYVITQAGRPSDVLAVELLQREAGIARPLRVVPLFETRAICAPRRT